MNVPINTNEFQLFVTENNLFETTRTLMTNYLKVWYEEDKDKFIEQMRADFETVIASYRFKNQGVSISKNYSYEPPQDYISCWILIFDNEEDYCAEYTAFFDYALYCFDDKLCS